MLHFAAKKEKKNNKTVNSYIKNLSQSVFFFFFLVNQCGSKGRYIFCSISFV